MFCSFFVCFVVVVVFQRTLYAIIGLPKDYPGAFDSIQCYLMTIPNNDRRQLLVEFRRIDHCSAGSELPRATVLPMRLS